MASDVILSPPDMEKLRTFLVAEQASLTKRREELLQKLGSLRPPGASKVAMYEWNESAEKLHQQLGRQIVSTEIWNCLKGRRKYDHRGLYLSPAWCQTLLCRVLCRGRSIANTIF